jgi:O-acetylhomoserine/O-acetylserine sulfhydrylase-like pyridoxal-dependent enzyme
VGDVQVFASGYRDNPSIYTRIENPDDAVLGRRLARMPGVEPGSELVVLTQGAL